jgi:hypothetical protein
MQMRMLRKIFRGIPRKVVRTKAVIWPSFWDVEAAKVVKDPS